MNHDINFAGQRIDYRESRDNVPVKYSAPSAIFKEILAGYAKPYCSRCRGTGYIGVFKHVCAGRCFKCIRETVWERVQEEFEEICETTGFDEMAEIYRAVCGDDGNPAYLCDGLRITPDSEIHDSTDDQQPSSKGHSAARRSTYWAT